MNSVAVTALQLHWKPGRNLFVSRGTIIVVMFSCSFCSFPKTTRCFGEFEFVVSSCTDPLSAPEPSDIFFKSLLWETLLKNFVQF